MTSGAYHFDRFVLDTADRRLTRDGAPVELNARYFDALALLVAADGALVTKEGFMTAVWRGVPVTDEALTQCIRTLRRALGDDAAAPRFIATVPKHGYRFVAAVDIVPTDGRVSHAVSAVTVGLLAGAGGGAAAGAAGGIVYGFTFDAEPGATGGASMLMVLLVVCAIVGALGGMGVGGGIGLVRRLSGHRWCFAPLGGAVGGLVIGAVVKLLGTDAFALLLGRSPGDVAGAVEGLVLGAAVGIGGWLGGVRSLRAPLRIAVAAVPGGVAGVAIALGGGRLMGGSLDVLAHGFTGSRLRMEQVGRVFGESGFGPVANAVTAGLEGALFAGCIVAAMILAERARRPSA